MIQDDGDVCIYHGNNNLGPEAACWCAETAGQFGRDPESSQLDWLQSGERIFIGGRVIVSKDTTTSLQLKLDGSLIVTDIATGKITVILEANPAVKVRHSLTKPFVQVNVRCTCSSSDLCRH